MPELTPQPTIPVLDRAKMLAFGQRLSATFKTYEVDRKEVEQQWLRNLRQFRGVYDPEIASHIPDDLSTAYPKITRTKVIGTLARMMEMLFPQTEKNWAIEPSPLPELETGDLQAVLDQLSAERGQALTDDDIEKAVYEFAEERAERLEKEIFDQLTELNYIDLARQVVFSGILYGPGTVEGPGVIQRKFRTWVKDPSSGSYRAVEIWKKFPYYEFVPCWEWYPDLSAKRLNQTDGSFRRQVMSRNQFAELAKRPDFLNDEINNWLRQNSTGNYKERDWEKILRASGDRANVNDLSGRKIEMLSYWGMVSGHELLACGVAIAPDKLEMMLEANVCLVGDVVVKAILTPYRSQRRPYSTFIYEQDDIKLLGNGLPEVIRDSQLGIAEAARAVLDNASVVCGPQVEIDTDLLLPGQDYDIYARKVWLRDPDKFGAGTDRPAVRNIQVDSHIPDLLSVIELFMRFADTEAALPPPALGDVSGQGKEPYRTAGGTSMLLGAAALPIRDVVRNYDLFTESFVGGLIDWNMQFNDNPRIRGDSMAVAKGSTSLVAKEVRATALNQLSQTFTPDERIYLKTSKIVHEKLKANDLPDDLLEDADVVVAKLKEQSDNAKAMAAIQQQLSGATIKSEVAKAFKDLMLGLKAQAAGNADVFNTIIEGIERVANTAGGEGSAPAGGGGTQGNSVPKQSRAGVAGASAAA